MARRRVAKLIAHIKEAGRRWSDELNPTEKSFLERFASYDGELDEARSGLKLAKRRFNWYLNSRIGIALVFVTIGYSGLLYVPSAKGFILLGVGFSAAVMTTVLSTFTSCKWAAYSSYLVMLRALRRVDPALPSVLASAERTVLARELLRCAARVRSFGSRPAFRLNKKIIRQLAIRASKVFQGLVYLAMLGDDKELEKVRSALARAILLVGTSNWVKIGDITVETDQYEAVQLPRRAFNSGQLLPIILVGLTAIPAIPILISTLK